MGTSQPNLGTSHLNLGTKWQRTKWFGDEVTRFALSTMLAEMLKTFHVVLAGVQYVAPGPDEKDVNVYFLPQKNSSELKFVLQFTVTFP